MKQLTLLLVLVMSILGAQGQTYEDCRTRLVYNGFTTVYTLTITNKMSEPSRFALQIPNCQEGVGAHELVTPIIEAYGTITVGVEHPFCCGVISIRPKVTGTQSPCGTDWLSTANICNTLPVSISKLEVKRDPKSDSLIVTFVIHEATNVRRFILNLTTDGKHYKPVKIVLPATLKLNEPNSVKIKI